MKNVAFHGILVGLDNAKHASIAGTVLTVQASPGDAATRRASAGTMTHDQGAASQGPC